MYLFPSQYGWYCHWSEWSGCLLPGRNLSVTVVSERTICWTLYYLIKIKYRPIHSSNFAPSLLTPPYPVPPRLYWQGPKKAEAFLCLSCLYDLVIAKIPVLVYFLSKTISLIKKKIFKYLTVWSYPLFRFRVNWRPTPLLQPTRIFRLAGASSLMP